VVERIDIDEATTNTNPALTAYRNYQVYYTKL